MTNIIQLIYIQCSTKRQLIIFFFIVEKPNTTIIFWSIHARFNAGLCFIFIVLKISNICIWFLTAYLCFDPPPLRVQKVETAKITCSNAAANQAGHFEDQKSESDIDISTEWNRCISVLLSKPILALKFNMLKMEVHAPSVVIPHISEKLDSKKDSTS